MAVSPYSSAQQARQGLANRLAELCRDAGLTGRDIAGLCDWSASKSSRIMNARTAPSVGDIQAWCRYRTQVEPLLKSDAPISHVVFEGLDGYRSVVLLEDSLANDVLIADRLDGRPLDSDHGAPVRLVSPGQYGFVSTKHLCRIEFHTSEPADPDRWSPLAAHRRARVWQEERHRRLPGRVVRPVYRALIGPIRALSARGSRKLPR